MQRNSAQESSIMSIMLLGSTGSGKSASGNTIIGVRGAFEEDCSPVAVSKICNSAQTVVDGQTLRVIDTVGLSETSVREKDAQTQIENMFTPHSVDVFLLVIKLGETFTTSMNVVLWIQDNFGAKALKHSIVLFTHGGQLRGPVESYLNKCETLRLLVDRCSGGFHVFNNKDEDPSQVIELLEKINTLRKKNKYGRYTEQDMKTQKDRIRKSCDANAAFAVTTVKAAGAVLGAVILLGAAAAGATVGAAVGGAAAVQEAVAGARAVAAAGAGVGDMVGEAVSTVGKAAIIGATKCAALVTLTVFGAGVYLWYAK